MKLPVAYGRPTTVFTAEQDLNSQLAECLKMLKQRYQLKEFELLQLPPFLEQPSKQIAEFLRAQRMVVLTAHQLDDQNFLADGYAQLATAARQLGIPCYLYVCQLEADIFTQRIYDLQRLD